MRLLAAISLILISSFSSAEEINNEWIYGWWWTAPCHFGSIHRPDEMPCSIEIDDKNITLNEEDIRKYKLIENKNNKITIEFSGEKNNWYKVGDNQFRFVFKKIDPFIKGYIKYAQLNVLSYKKNTHNDYFFFKNSEQFNVIQDKYNHRAALNKSKQQD